MVRVAGVDHIAIRVSDFKASKSFCGKLFAFLGFKVLGEYADTIGWTNGKTRYWIGQAEAKRRTSKYRIGAVGLHHYAFALGSRKQVDALEAFVRSELGARIVDPADEYYDDYYAVFFLDPDGIKREGMKWGEKSRARRKKRAKKG